MRFAQFSIFDFLDEFCLSNDKFKYPTNDKNSDPGLI